MKNLARSRVRNVVNQVKHVLRKEYVLILGLAVALSFCFSLSLSIDAFGETYERMGILPRVDAEVVFMTETSTTEPEQTTASTESTSVSTTTTTTTTTTSTSTTVTTTTTASTSTTTTTTTETTQTEPTETDSNATEPIARDVAENSVFDYISEDEIIMLAKTIAQEAGDCSYTQQACVVWTVLNRVDDSAWPDTISANLTMPSQFAYRAGKSYRSDHYDVAYDQVYNWLFGGERYLDGGYQYFYGDGKRNHFYGNGNAEYCPD